MLSIAGYGSYKAYQMFKKFREGIDEFQKIMKQFDKMKEGLPDDEQFEEGTDEELGFMK